MLLVLLLSYLHVTGCGSRGADPLAAYQDLSGVPLSDELRPLVQSGVALLSRPDPDNAVTRSLAVFDSLRATLERPATRATAVAAAVDRCRRDPESFVWIYLLMDNAWRDRCRSALDTLLAEPPRSDTTTAVGRYVRAWQSLQAGDRGTGFRRLEPLRDDLDPLSRFMLELNLVETDSNTRGPRFAVQRLLAVLPEAMAAGGCRLGAYFWRALARHLRRMDRLDDALHAVVLAQAMADRAGDRYHAFRIATTRLLLLASRGDRTVADTLAEACFRIAAREDFPGSLEEVLDRRAEFLEESLGDFPAALIVRKQLLRHSLAAADSVNVPRDMWNVADDYLHLGEVDSAGVYVRRAREWIRRSSIRENKEIFPLFDAQYRYFVGDFAAADSLMDLVRTGGGMVWEEADRLHDMIRTGIALGRPAMAYRALARLRRLQPVLVDNRADQNLRADLELDTADLLARQGEFAAAAAALARAERYVNRPGAADRRWMLHRRRGELALLRGDLATARAELLRSRELAPSLLTRHPISFLLGHVLLADGRPAGARALFASLAADTTRGVPYRTRTASRLMLAVCDEREGKPAAALARCEAVRAGLTPHSPADLRLEAAVVHGHLLATAGRFREAHAVLRDAMALVGAHGSTRHDTDLLRFMQDTGRELAELLVGLEADHPELVDGAAAERTLAAALTIRTALAGAGPPPTPDDLRCLDGPVLVFQVGHRRSFAWSLGADGIRLEAHLPGRAGLKRLLGPVLAGVAAPARPLDRVALDSLARALLAPLAGRWETGRLLHLVPDDLLHAVPWAALPWRDGEALLDHGPLCELPVPAPCPAPGTTVSPRELRLLAVGLDDSPGEGVPVLRHAQEEAALVAGLWSPDRATLLAGGRAAWGDSLAADLARHDVIHVASHLVVTSGLPSRGTLRFPGRGGAVPLTVQQVGRLPLHAELIYLSCCEAAGGGGGGLADFARAFLAAGARTVVASAQPVEDEAAARIAVGFYRRWLAGTGRAAALRDALLALRDSDPRWRHPFYWATFRLMGDGT